MHGRATESFIVNACSTLHLKPSLAMLWIRDTFSPLNIISSTTNGIGVVTIDSGSVVVSSSVGVGVVVGATSVVVGATSVVVGAASVVVGVPV